MNRAASDLEVFEMYREECKKAAASPAAGAHPLLARLAAKNLGSEDSPSADNVPLPPPPASLKLALDLSGSQASPVRRPSGSTPQSARKKKLQQQASGPSDFTLLLQNALSSRSDDLSSSVTTGRSELSTGRSEFSSVAPSDPLTNRSDMSSVGSTGQRVMHSPVARSSPPPSGGSTDSGASSPPSSPLPPGLALPPPPTFVPDEPRAYDGSDSYRQRAVLTPRSSGKQSAGVSGSAGGGGGGGGVTTTHHSSSSSGGPAGAAKGTGGCPTPRGVKGFDDDYIERVTSLLNSPLVAEFQEALNAALVATEGMHDDRLSRLSLEVRNGFVGGVFTEASISAFTDDLSLICNMPISMMSTPAELARIAPLTADPRPDGPRYPSCAELASSLVRQADEGQKQGGLGKGGATSDCGETPRKGASLLRRGGMSRVIKAVDVLPGLTTTNCATCRLHCDSTVSAVRIMDRGLADFSDMMSRDIAAALLMPDFRRVAVTGIAPGPAGSAVGVVVDVVILPPMATGGRIKKHLAESLTAFEVVLAPSDVTDDDDGDAMDITITARWAALACGDDDWEDVCLSLHPTLKIMASGSWGQAVRDDTSGLCARQCKYTVQLTVPPSSDCPPLACMATARCLGNVVTLLFAVPCDAVTAPQALGLASGNSTCYQGVGSAQAGELGAFHLLPHTAAEKVIQRRRA